MARGRSASRGASQSPAAKSSSKTKQRLGAAAQSPAPAAKTATTRTKAAAVNADLNPLTTEFEFVGPYVGPVGIILGLPILTWAYSYFCNAKGWPTPDALSSLQNLSWELVASSWDSKVFLVYTAYWLLQALLYLVVPCQVVQGVQLRDGSRLKYPLNGACANPHPSRAVI